MIVETPPSAAQHCVARSEYIIGCTDSGLVEEGPGGEPSDRDRIVSRVPIEPAECGRGRAIRVVLRLVENRVTEAFTIDPGREVSEAQAEFKGQFPGRLPRVLNEAFKGVVGDIVEAVEIRLVVAVTGCRSA